MTAWTTLRMTARTVLAVTVMIVSGLALAGPEDFVQMKKHDFTVVIADSAPKPCVLRKETAKALAQAQATLKISDQRLKLYHCYEPGNSGTHVSVALVDSAEKEIVMPSKRGETKESVDKREKKRAKKNAERLRSAMERAGFTSHGAEWWRYELKGEFPSETFAAETVK